MALSVIVDGGPARARARAGLVQATITTSAVPRLILDGTVLIGTPLPGDVEIAAAMTGDVLIGRILSGDTEVP